MKEFREREACGLPLLLFTIGLVEGLERLERSWCLYATMEFPVVVDKLKPGVKPACDAAVVAIVDGNEKPVVLFDYKPTVHPRKEVLVRQDLMEVLIQGYYSLYQHGVSSIVHCLTDLEQFDYFKMEKAGTRKMRRSWNFFLSEQDIKNSQMPLTDGEKVKAFLLAPSTYHESRLMCDVANSILEGGILAGDTLSEAGIFCHRLYCPQPRTFHPGNRGSQL